MRATATMDPRSLRRPTLPTSLAELKTQLGSQKKAPQTNDGATGLWQEISQKMESANEGRPQSWTWWASPLLKRT